MPVCDTPSNLKEQTLGLFAEHVTPAFASTGRRAEPR